MDFLIPQNNILNTKRFFVDAIEKASQEQGIQTSWISDDWVCRLEKGDIHHLIYGYNFPLNSVTSFEVAKDKTATSMLLEKNNIPCATHELFMTPNLSQYSSKEEYKKRISKLIDIWKFPLICKNNRGAGGNNVFKVHTQQDLVIALDAIWKVSRGAAISPFYEIENEYRFFVLDGKVELAYKKIVSKEDGWKFNLSKGGSVELINHEDYLDAIDLALEAAKELNLRVCSVDLIKTKDKNRFLVLEVNTGITTEYFSQSSPEAKVLAENLYSSILKNLFK
jgi:glutathione synthase/RimK-type ligase-like ATP-grasp enzyme